MKKENTSTRLKQIMKEKNLKQSEILRKCKPVCNKYIFENGKKVQITKSDLSQWISGKYEPGQWKLTILAEALNTNEVWLMGYDVPNVPKNEYDEAIKTMDQNSDVTESDIEEVKKRISIIKEFTDDEKKTLLNMIDYFHNLANNDDSNK